MEHDVGAAVREALGQDAFTKSIVVQVDVRDGQVVLRGRVSSWYTRQMVGQVAAQVLSCFHDYRLVDLIEVRERRHL